MKDPIKPWEFFLGAAILLAFWVTRYEIVATPHPKHFYVLDRWSHEVIFVQANKTQVVFPENDAR